MNKTISMTLKKKKDESEFSGLNRSFEEHPGKENNS